MLDVTVIIPTYNRSPLLAEALASLRQQTHKPREILVVDDGSQDETAQLATQAGGAVRYLRKDNGGKSSALNLGLANARGEAIWILDDDDLALPESLARLAQTLESRPDAGFAYGALREFRSGRGGRRRLGRERGRLALEGRCYFHAVLDGRAVTASPAFLVRRACYEAVGPYDEGLVRSQDLEMLLRLSRRFTGVPAAGVVFLQRQHGAERGAASDRFAAVDRDRRWAEADRLIFTRFLAELPLAELLPEPSVEPLTPAEVREARLVRFAVLARRKLWPEAIGELEAIGEAEAQAPLTGGPLTPRELATAATALHAPYGIEDLARDGELAGRLQQAAVTLGGQELLRAVAEAIPHHGFYALRHGRLAASRRLFALNRRLLGRGAARQSLFSATARRLAWRREEA